MRVRKAFANGRRTLILGTAIAISLTFAVLWLASPGVTGPHGDLLSAVSAAVAGDATAGEAVYVRRCSPCHGIDGDGNGAAAKYLSPRPRDFTRGSFKLRTTETGEPPLDSDLIRTVKEGIPSTAMPTWESALSSTEIEDVVAYIKTFAPDRFDPAFPPIVVEVGSAPSVNQALVDRGREIFQRVECWKCHGDQGKSDGESSPTLEDDWENFIRARNLTKAWRFKRDGSIEEIFTRLTTGMDGSPMPSFQFDLGDDERWAVAAYVNSLAQEESDAAEVVLRAPRVSGDLPIDPFDSRWDDAKTLQVPMTGQVIAAPRWQNHSVDMMEVKSLHNDQEVAFLLTWDDPHEDTVHDIDDADDQGLDGPYADWDIYGPKPEAPERPLPSFRDAVSVQLPKEIPEGARKPHFLWGRSNDPVNLWMWKSDLNEQAGEGAGVEQIVARGHLTDREATDEDGGLLGLTAQMESLLTPQPAESQDVWGQGSWDEGTWRVVMKRPLSTPDDQDLQIETGTLIPISFQAWDGSNGERGLMMSISSWQFLLLDKPTPINVYLYTLIGVLAAIAIEAGLVWRYRRRS